MAVESRGGWLLIRQNPTEQELEQLETCLGNLYEDLDSKIRATEIILDLAKRIECLAALATHSSALCALSRILREEGRKSFTLRMNIISIFFIFSFFKNFHQTLLGQNVGRATLQVLALEIHITGNFIKPPLDSSKELCVRGFEQEKLLLMSINLLLNLAQNIHIEEKMKKFFLVELLCKSLESDNTNLLLMTITFLKKLSVFKENKDTMKENGIVLKLARLLPCENEFLFQAVLGLLRNLSFDPWLKSEMSKQVNCKLVQTLGNLIQQPKCERPVSALFYSLSTDSSFRPVFSETEVMPTLLRIILSEPMRDVPEEMMALAVNLTTVPSIAEALCEPFVVEKLLKRATQFGHSFLFKVIRNVSNLEDAKSFLLCFVPDLITFFLEGAPAIQVEVMGALNNMVWFEETTDVLVRKNLLQAFAIRVNSFESDILLEICMFLGAVCSYRTAPMISEAGLTVKLCSSFLEREKQADTDLTTQFLYMFSRFLLFDPTRRDLLTMTEKMAAYALKLLRDPNKVLAKLADTLFNILMEVDLDNYVRLKYMRFMTFNSCWD